MISAYYLKTATIACLGGVLLSSCSLHPTKGSTRGACLDQHPPKKVRVNATSLWNETGIRVVQEGVYLFTVERDAKWLDASIESRADGYNCPMLMPFVPFRRKISAPWFSLICTVDFKDSFTVFDHSPCFREGQEKSCSQQHEGLGNGDLYCYANDVSFMYGNNSGYIDLSVERVDANGCPEPKGDVMR